VHIAGVLQDRLGQPVLVGREIVVLAVCQATTPAERAGARRRRPLIGRQHELQGVKRQVIRLKLERRLQADSPVEE
jgi:hypothetical protein